MFYDLNIFCPYCKERHLLEPDYPNDTLTMECHECKKEFAFKLDVTHEVSYYKKVKK